MAYLMEHAGEAQRIERKTDVERTTEMLTATGLAPGMRALDVGCASGATTRAMARVVGPGLAVGVDLSEERLAFGRDRAREEGLEAEFRVGDATRLPFEDGSFDYVWARFLFEYLREPEAVLREMIRVCRPGGLVVVGDLDGNCIYHYPLPPELDAQMQAVMAVAAKVGFDPHVGRKLFTFFKRAGLADIAVRAEPYHLFAGPIPVEDQENWWAKLDVLAPVGARALGSAEAYARFAEQMRAFLLRDDTLTYSTLFLVRGRRPV